MVDIPPSKLAAAGPSTGAEIMEVSQLSDSVTISAATISALASDNSYNDSANGFVAAGFAVDNYVTVAGFTGNVANNIFSAKITALTAGKMTIGGVDGNVIVDDAAGESVSITKWVARRARTQTIGLSVVATDADDYTVLAADNNKYVRLTDATAKTITVQDDATEPLPDNGEWHFRNAGAGDATFDPDVGVTINVPAGGTLVVPEGGTVTLKRVAADEFDLIGATVPA